MRRREFKRVERKVARDPKTEPRMPEAKPEIGASSSGPRTLTPPGVVGLQRDAGNSAVVEMLSTDSGSPATVQQLLQRRARGAAAPQRTGKLGIARLKEDPSPFKGAAGTADVRAGEAGKLAGGVTPINVSTDYANEQAERKEKQMTAFLHEDIPFVSDNQEHYAYKKLIELRQEYVDDAARITLAQGAYNDFVVPATLAMKSMASFKAVQFELGYFDDSDLTEDLSKKELDVLGKKLDEKQLRTLNDTVTTKQEATQGLQKQILGTSHSIQAAMQRRAAALAADQRVAAEKEKTEIDEKIKAVKEGVETVGKVIEAVSFGGFGAPEAIGKIAEGGAEGLKGGLELGKGGTSLVGSAVEFIMTEMYKDQIQKAKQEIEKAKTAEAHAKKMDAQLSLEGSMLTVEGQLEQLAGAMGDLALALRARKDYFAKLGAETEAATGTKKGSGVEQFLTYVSQASETKAHLENANAAATSGVQVMGSKIKEMATHRSYAYVADSAGVWDDRARRVDPEGPDLEELKGASKFLDSFLEASNKELLGISRVIGSLPAAK